MQLSADKNMVNLNIAKKTEEKLLGRTLVHATVEYEAAVPSRKQISESISKKLSVEPALVVVFRITPTFGSKKADVIAYAYHNKAVFANVEEKKKLKRTGHVEEKAAVVEGA